MEASEHVSSVEKYLCEKATLNLVPISAVLELTPLCNMNCNMCFIRLSHDELKHRGGLYSIEKWLTLAEEMQKAGTIFVLITGGEPLLYPGFRTLYLRLKELGMIPTINTNGTLIDEAWADFFAEHRPRRINITLYGKDEATYDALCHYSLGYAKTLNAIQLLKERNIDVKINGSLTPDNINDADWLVQLADSFDTAWKIDTYMFPVSRERSQPFDQNARLAASLAAKYRVKFLRLKMGEKAFCSFAEQFLQRASATPSGKLEHMPLSCRAGRSSFAVNWQGQMRPCVLLPKPEVPVFEVGFQTAWKQMVAAVNQIALSPRCNACTLREVCNTCAACALSESGSFDGVPDYMCRYTEETLNCLQQELSTAGGQRNEG